MSNSIEIQEKEEFRKWLEKNHLVEKRIQVVLFKRHTGKPAPTHRELINEAICYGWIDTTIKKLDEDRYIRTFAKRNKNSSWSENTLGYAKELIKEGRMQPYGMEMYELGVKKPVHDDGIPKNPDIPDALQQLVDKDQTLKEKLEATAPSTTRMFYRWYLSAKRDETKQKRLDKIVQLIKTGSKQIY